MRIAVAAAAALAFASSFAASAADEPARKTPDASAGAKSDVFEWTSAGGIACRWRAPKSYDPAKGANVTIVLHGSNLTRQWGFANHDAGGFRPDDFVLCPDGTTPNGKGGFNFLEGDVKKAHELLGELKKLVKVRSVFAYGHSQGSFFSLAWAGAHPDDLQGVVAHASGRWASTQTGPRSHGQAIVLMHGTQDPVVPYVQSAASIQDYRDAGYPAVRLRSLEWWNHWPAELNGPVRHTSLQLAWVEGMTTTDAARLESCFAQFENPDPQNLHEHDFAGLWTLAGRIEAWPDAPAPLRARAAKARAAVEELAAAHVAALGVPEKPVFDGKPWMFHLAVFLRQFEGVPARETLARKLEPVLAAHRKDGIAALKKHYAAARSGKVAEAFDAGADAIRSGFLWCECQDTAFLDSLAEWQKDPKKHKLSKAGLKSWDAVIEPFTKARQDGWKAFTESQRRWK